MIFDNVIPLISPAYLLFLSMITLWDVCWKGIALWHASRRRQKIWFISLLLLNTVGILPIIYLILYRKKKKGK